MLAVYATPAAEPRTAAVEQILTMAPFGSCLRSSGRQRRMSLMGPLTLIAKQRFQASSVTSPVRAWCRQCSTQAKAHYSHTEDVHHSCAIDKNIQRTPVLEHLANGIADVGFGRDIALHEEFGGIFGSLCCGDVQAGDFGPLLEKQRDNRSTDSRASSGDDCNLWQPSALTSCCLTC